MLLILSEKTIDYSTTLGVMIVLQTNKHKRTMPFMSA